MTQLLSGVEAPSDAELISRVRGGDSAAYGDLFARHVDAARRLGRQLVRGPDVDDLVSEAFAKMLQVLQSGGGPDVAFRAYLLTSVRRLHVDRIRASSRLQTTDDMEKYDDGIPFQDTAVASFENGAAARAFSSLPERWQLVLWHLEVEGQKPAEIAPLLGMSANSVSALAYRAREGLRQAFLTMHLADSPTEECRWVNEHLGAFVRKGLSRRDTTKVQEHLDGCRRCTAMYLELTEVNSNLSGIIAPLLLGAAAAGYLSSSGAVGGIAGVSALFGRVRDTVSANAGAAVGGAVAAGVAAITAATFVLGGGNGDREVLIEADQTVETVRTPPSEGAGSPGTSADREAEAPSEASSDASSGASSEDAEVQGVKGAAAPSGAVDPAGDESSVLFTDALAGPAPTGGSPGGSDAPTSGGGDPGAAPADDPGPGPGSNPDPDPDPGPGSDPGPGPGSDPGPGPGSDPDPGPAPGPGSDPGPGPGPDPTVTTTLSFSGTGIVDDDTLVFSLLGDPVLPSTITLTLVSEPQITFGDAAECTESEDGTEATCTPVPSSGGVGTAALRATATASGAYQARIPVVVPTGDSAFDVTLEVTVADGYTNVGQDSIRFTYLPTGSGSGDPGDGSGGDGDGDGDGDIPVAFDMTAVTRVQVGDAGEQLEYLVHATFLGVEDGGEVSLTLREEQDRFRTSDDCTVADDGRTLTCEVAEGTERLEVEFVAWLPGQGQREGTLIAEFGGTTDSHTFS